MRRLLIIGMLLLAVGCGTKDPLEPVKPPVILPLAEGNIWTYSYVTYDSLGFIARSVTLTREVTQKVAIGGETWSELTSIEEGSPPTVKYVVNRSDGLWQADSETGVPYFGIKYPGKVNDLYTGINALGVKGITVTIGGIGENVTTPAGEYPCYRYVWSFLFFGYLVEGTEYWAPDVGLMRMEATFTRTTDSKIYSNIVWQLTEKDLK
ncbi:MAG: hypothetical protein OEW00_03810 [candidate division Zixibacteria bacterium]|nr:hypothetical protein [candidate division Zixibacteria bacterium]